jgi:DNA-binding SARP family transcriptional activator
LQVRVLGPFDVVVGDEVVPIGGGRQRILLAILALHANEVVPAGRLIDELWPEEPPESALNTLQGHVSRLRKALDPNGANGHAIAYRHGGYVLDLRPEQIDAHRFAQLVGEAEARTDAGDPGEAGRLLREALALWRGVPLSDFADEPFARPEIARLEELRLKAIEDRIDADLTCGRHAAVVAELEALVAQHPLRERLRGQLMLALYRSGRQGDALAAYREARTALEEQLGVEPTPALRELELAILRHDRSLEPPARVRGRLVANRRLPLRVRIGGAIAALLIVVAVGLALRGGGRQAIVVVPNSVAVINARTNEIVDDVVVGDYPGPIAARAGRVWVGNIGANTMTEIDAGTHEPEFPAGVQRPLDIALTDDATWTANATDFQTTPPTGGGTVERRELRDGALTTRRVGPKGAIDEGSTFVATAGRAVWAASATSRMVVRLDPRDARITARVAGVEGGAIAIGYNSVWVVEPTRNTVARVNTDLARVEARVPISGSPERVAVGEGSVWVTTTGQHSALWRIDPRSNETIAVIPLPPTARRVATGAGHVWVTSGRGNAEGERPRRDGRLTKIDPRTNEIVASIELGFRPDGVVVANGLVWVAVAPV